MHSVRMKCRAAFIVSFFFVLSPNFATADDCQDIGSELNSIGRQVTAARSAARSEDDYCAAVPKWVETIRIATRRLALRERFEAPECNRWRSGGMSSSEIRTEIARFQKDLASARSECADQIAHEKQLKQIEAEAKARAAKEKAEAEARAKAAKAKAEAEALAKAKEKAAAELKKDPPKKDGPARPSDPKQCISETISPLRNGYHDYNFRNSCEVTITFDIDDCDPGPNFEVNCKVKAISVGAKTSWPGSNYRQRPNARNFR